MIDDKVKKPLLLIFPFDVLAHYLRCLRLARYLSEYFEIQFLRSARYSSFINREGYATFHGAALDADKVQDGIRQFDFTWLNKTDLEEIYLSQVDIINKFRPAVVLGDMSPTLKMAAETTGIKYIALMNGYMSRHYAKVHPMPRSHPFYKSVKLLPDALARCLIQIGEQLSFKEIQQPFREIRAEYGLIKRFSYLDEMEGDVNLLCDLPELFPQKTLPPNYFFVPPLYYDNTRSSSDILKRLDKNRRTIFVSMGSTGNWNNVTFLNHPFFEKFNIVTAGDNENIVNNPRVIKAGFISMHDLFPHTDLVICHGGNGTVYQALFYGLPVLCRTAHFEQEWNVHMLESFYLGKSLDLVKTETAYHSIVDEWILKKYSPELLQIQKKMQEADKSFYSTMYALVKNVFAISRTKLLQPVR